MCNQILIDDFDKMKMMILKKIPDAQIVLQNTEEETHHLKILVVSDQFVNQTIIQQHRSIMNSLKEKFQQDLHAVQIKTMTKANYKVAT